MERRSHAGTGRFCPAAPARASGRCRARLYPKQLLPLTGPHTMLQDTLTRLAGFAGAGAPIVVCNEAHRFLVAEQLRALVDHAGAIVLEPVGRNTAPAVALAAHAGGQGRPGRRSCWSLPADHVIRDVAAFHRAAEVALAQRARPASS